MANRRRYTGSAAHAAHPALGGVPIPHYGLLLTMLGAAALLAFGFMAGAIRKWLAGIGFLGQTRSAKGDGQRNNRQGGERRRGGRPRNRR